eukprot:TRINITY_DN518_c0_g1_i1.p1 TRINITY_DN518_c0_g1~~TRINITY_DN518_c0_g1_i1.p1  ORF type:complete len:412 (-),score=91.12 TRINITY_DN518_c0_g1_i1:27-1262(-)
MRISARVALAFAASLATAQLILLVGSAAAAPLPLIPRADGSWAVTHSNVASILLGVSFSDTRSGYFAGAINGVGPVIYKTTDGGRTISAQTIEGLSATYMDIVASSPTSAMTGGLGMWWAFAGASYTTDGATWKSTETEKWLASAYQDIQTKDGVYFLPGFWANVSISGNGLAVSHDGGKTLEYIPWTPAEEPARYASFIDRNTGFIAGGHWPSTSAKVFGDQSQGFSYSSKIRLPSVGLGRQASNPMLHSTTGYRGVISKTVDGGRTWQVVFDHAGDYYFNTIDFVSATHGWVVGEGESEAFIMGTTDGGRSWTKQYSIGRGSLMALDMINENEGWAAGLDGTGTSNTALFLRTTDGGRTWVQYASTSKHAITNISAVDSDHVWAVGINLVSSLCSIFQWMPATGEMRLQ